MVKNLPPKQETKVRFLGWEDSREKEWQLTPVFLPGKCHGQRILVGYSPWVTRVRHALAAELQQQEPPYEEVVFSLGTILPAPPSLQDLIDSLYNNASEAPIGSQWWSLAL